MPRACWLAVAAALDPTHNSRHAPCSPAPRFQSFVASASLRLLEVDCSCSSAIFRPTWGRRRVLKRRGRIDQSVCWEPVPNPVLLLLDKPITKAATPTPTPPPSAPHPALTATCCRDQSRARRRRSARLSSFAASGVYDAYNAYDALLAREPTAGGRCCSSAAHVDVLRVRVTGGGRGTPPRACAKTLRSSPVPDALLLPVN